VTELVPRQHVNKLEEVIRRNIQGTDERLLDRARHFVEPSLAVLTFEQVALGDRH
jgi:hypothetical protein